MLERALCPLKHCCFYEAFWNRRSEFENDECLELDPLLRADTGGKGMFDLGHLSDEVGGFD